MKTATFRKVKLSIGRSTAYGHYTIQSTYRGKNLTALTTDSQAFDYLDDDSDKELHQAAKRHCYSKIVQAYENSI